MRDKRAKWLGVITNGDKEANTSPLRALPGKMLMGSVY